jgi:hypothetical protein
MARRGSPIHRQHLIERYGGSVPTSDGVEGHVQACFERQLFEPSYVFGARAGTAAAIFIFELDADDWPVVFPQKTM